MEKSPVTARKTTRGWTKNMAAPQEKFISNLNLYNCNLKLYRFNLQIYNFSLKINFPSYPRMFFLLPKATFPSVPDNYPTGGTARDMQARVQMMLALLSVILVIHLPQIECNFTNVKPKIKTR